MKLLVISQFSSAEGFQAFFYFKSHLENHGPDLVQVIDLNLSFCTTIRSEFPFVQKKYHNPADILPEQWVELSLSVSRCPPTYAVIHYWLMACIFSPLDKDKLNLLSSKMIDEMHYGLFFEKSLEKLIGKYWVCYSKQSHSFFLRNI